MAEEWQSGLAVLLKFGTSYTITVPKHIVRYLNLKERDELKIKLCATGKSVPKKIRPNNFLKVKTTSTEEIIPTVEELSFLERYNLLNLVSNTVELEEIELKANELFGEKRVEQLLKWNSRRIEAAKEEIIQNPEEKEIIEDLSEFKANKPFILEEKVEENDPDKEIKEILDERIESIESDKQFESELNGK